MRIISLNCEIYDLRLESYHDLNSCLEEIVASSVCRIQPEFLIRANS
jgi:hypothetical protein